MEKTFWQAIQERRSIYALSDEVIVPQEKIKEIVANTLTYTPTAFHSQSARLVVLFGEKHKKLWKIVLDALKEITPPDKFPQTEAKVNGSFAAGYGTVLFYEDTTVVKGLQSVAPLYAENFPKWAQQSNAMHQLIVWAGLEAEGLGASLQHYNPLIDEALQKEWKIPSDWELIAQMPFGKPLVPAGAKEVFDIDARMRIIK